MKNSSLLTTRSKSMAVESSKKQSKEALGKEEIIEEAEGENEKKG